MIFVELKWGVREMSVNSELTCREKTESIGAQKWSRKKTKKYIKRGAKFHSPDSGKWKVNMTI